MKKGKKKTFIIQLFKKYAEYFAMFLVVFALCCAGNYLSKNQEKFAYFINKLIAGDLLMGISGIYFINLVVWIIASKKKRSGKFQEKVFINTRLALIIVLFAFWFIFAAVGVLSRVALQDGLMKDNIWFWKDLNLIFIVFSWFAGAMVNVLCDLLRNSLDRGRIQ